MITSGSEGMASHIVDEPVRGALGDQQASATGHSGAEAYDRWFESRWGRYAAAIERDTLLRAIGPVEHDLVLDAGCGTGRFSVAMERAGARVVGLDIDMDMLAIAVRRLAGPVVLGDIEHLPIRDAVFDVAAAVTVLEFVPHPERALAELLRVTRPGGTVVIGALNRRSPWGLAHRRRGNAWAGGRLFTTAELAALAESQGKAVSMTGALMAPGPFPGLQLLGPALERIGSRFSRIGAFQVLVMRRS